MTNRNSRWGRTDRKRRRPHEAVALARASRRAELLAETLRDVPPERVTYAWVAERTGVPLGYLTWRFPTVADLRALAR